MAGGETRRESEIGTEIADIFSEQNKSYRHFVVITPDRFLEHAMKITCVPIGAKSNNRFLHVPLTKGEAGCTKDGFVWCDEVYTLELEHFHEELGRLPDDRALAVAEAVRDYLGY